MIPLLLLCVTLLCAGSCKEEKKSNDIITKIAPRKKPPRGPQKLSDFKYERQVDWLGSTYTIRIRRFADKELAMTEDEDGRKYYDNKVQLVILRKDGSEFYDRTFTKDDFKAFTDNQYGRDGALVGFMFDRAEGNSLYFGASVGSPDPNSDEYVPIDVSIDNMSHLHITNAVQLDTGSDQPRPAKEKTEDELAEEEGI